MSICGFSEFVTSIKGLIPRLARYSAGSLGVPCEVPLDCLFLSGRDPKAQNRLSMRVSEVQGELTSIPARPLIRENVLPMHNASTHRLKAAFAKFYSSPPDLNQP